MAERIFSATVNGKRRQVLMMMDDSEHNDIEAGKWLMFRENRYFNMFYWDASPADLAAPITDMKLKKPRT